MMRYLCAAFAILAMLSEVSIAQTATVPAPSAAPVATPSAPATTAATDELVTTLKAQTAEMRRSEDRLLSNIHWTLGTVVALALGLGAFSWWSSKTVYDRDIAKMKEGVIEQIERRLKFALPEQEERLDAKQRQRIDRLQAEGIAHTLGHVADLRLANGDVAGSIRAVLEQYSAAKAGNTNYVAHALDKLIVALSAAETRQLTIDPNLIRDVKGVWVETAATDSAKAHQLNALLNKFPASG